MDRRGVGLHVHPTQEGEADKEEGGGEEEEEEEEKKKKKRQADRQTDSLIFLFFDSFFILRMTVLGRSLIFQPVLLACTYNNKTILTLQKKIDSTEFPSKFTHKKYRQCKKT